MSEEPPANADRVRDDHEIGEKAPGEVRLLFRGDSSCFGVFRRPEETFVHRTEVGL